MAGHPRGTPDFSDVRVSSKARCYEAPPALDEADEATATAPASPAPRCFSEAPAMTPPVAEPWTTARYSTKPTKHHLTIVIKLTDGVSLSALQSTHLTDAVTAAAHLTPSEAKETYFKIRDRQNVLIADTYRPSAQEKLVQTTKLTIANRDYAVTSYPSAPTNSCKGVIHGVASLIAPDELIANIESNVPVLTARTMGKTETALITFEGTYVPYTIYYRRLQFRCHPHKPKSQQCQNCLQLGHRAEVCPKKGKLTVCDICYQENMTSDTLHNCVPYCVNRKEERASKDPNCPAKKQAGAQATHAAYKRRVQQRPKATTIPKTLRTPPPPPKPKGGKASATPSPPHHPTPPSDKQHRRTRSLSCSNKVREPLRSTLHPTHASRPKFIPHPITASDTYKQALLAVKRTPTTPNTVQAINAALENQHMDTLPPPSQPVTPQVSIELKQIMLVLKNIHERRAAKHVTPTLVTAYISKEHPPIQLNTTDINTAHQEHVIITLQPRNCPNPITIVANPTPWLTKLVANNTDLDILLVGDLNSPNVSWGYSKTQHNGRLLEQATAQTSMTLANDTTQLTRTGNTVERDTNPDLAFHHGPSVAEWSASDEPLGSDHRIIHLTLITNVKQKVRRNTARVTNWDHFSYHTCNNPRPTDADPRAWANHLLQAQNKCTKEAQFTTATLYIDTHLLNLWKTRRKLQLTTENWLQLCDSLNGQLGAKKTWRILRTLLPPSQPRDPLTRIMLASKIISHDLEQQLRDTFFPPPTDTPHTPEPPTPPLDPCDMDAPFPLNELKRALDSLKRNASPGEDQITYQLLRNLDDTQLQQLLNYFNSAWQTGDIPAEWKHAIVTMIPKPNKTSEVKKLRPISLTSCTGKLLEKIVLTRLEWHLEHVKALPFTLFGYRKNISTQDCLLRIYNDLLQDKSTTQLRLLLSLDIYKAFDNVSHESILSTLRETQCGPRMYNYIRNFPSNRTATFKIPGHISIPFQLHQGVPQGSILSPTLFNLAMSKLPAKLDTIPHLKFSIYADDVTLWTNTGSPGQQEETLQHACDTDARYAISLGLACSPSDTPGYKSELLVISNCKNNPERQLVTVHLDGTPIPQRPQIKLLGLTIQNNDARDITISTLSKQINQITHILGRVSRHHRGLKESDMRRAIEALIYSLVLYHIPYTPLTNRQLKHLQAQLRKPTRLALGVPQYVPLEHLQQMDPFNTLEERVDLHRLGQQQRLTTSLQGRYILNSLGYDTLHLPPIETTTPP
ncbi:hypothetical protein HPB47_010386 [Ixodes persulcatus]|uniref:Uncharacterized protein n=1 Tax=Ixodes persulcatus TaxID=34615 RepID=A0AC60NZ83_IXOPE|nr:hypothetical protein HPB47_010386 [Ixodes persulcatus]